MRLPIVISCLLMLSISSAWGASPVENFSSIVAHYQTYSATFIQTTTSSEGRVIASGQGRFWLNRPDHFRWQSEKPSKQILVGDGHYVWNYNADLMQVTKQRYSSQGQAPIQLLLSGGKALSSHFRVVEKEELGKRAYYLTANSPEDSGFKQVAFYFHGKELVRMQLENTLGQKTIFRFSEIRINPKLTTELFSFQPPTGVDVIKNDLGS